MIDVADAVTCSSSEIARIVQNYHGNVHYIPDAINLSHFSPPLNRPVSDNSRLRVVWNGVSSKILELTPILPFLSSQGIELVVISESERKARAALAGFSVTYQFRRWSYVSFPSDLMRGDLGLSIKDPDSRYENANSSFKILAPMAMGLPVLASPIPSYREALSQGGGHLCSDIDSFEHHLKELSGQVEQRKILGAEARRGIQRFGIDSVAEKLATVIGRLF
jgi:hypothetical protein